MEALNCPFIVKVFIDWEIARSNNGSVITVFLPMVFKGLNWDWSPTRIQNGEIYKYMQILRKNIAVYPAFKPVNRSNLFVTSDK